MENSSQISSRHWSGKYVVEGRDVESRDVFGKKKVKWEIKEKQCFLAATVVTNIVH